MTDSKKVVLKRPEDAGGREAELLEYVNMSIGEDFVSVSTALKKSGTTKTGKTWVNFEDQRVLIFKLGRYTDGRPRVNVYLKQRMGRGYDYLLNRQSRKVMQFTNVTSKISTFPYMMNQYDVVALGEFIKIYDREFGPSGQYPTTQGIKRLAYPMLRDNERWQYNRDLGSALRQTNVRAFIDSSFGKTRYRKDLVKAIANTNSTHAIAFGWAFRGLMPMDWIIDALNGTKPYRQYAEYGKASNLRTIAKLTDENSRRRLLRQMLNEDVPAPWIQDSLRSLDRIREYGDVPTLGRVQNWREAHDSLMVQARQAVKKNRRIPQDNKVIGKIDGVEFSLEGDKTVYHFESAKDTDTLEMWGSQMANCIGSYDSSAMNGYSLLFGLYAGDTLIGNMELDPNGRVRQLVGKYNGQLSRGKEISRWVEDQTKPELAQAPQLNPYFPAINPGALVEF